MRRFGTDKVKTMIQNLGYDETVPLRSKMFSKVLKPLKRRLKEITMICVKALLDYDNIVSEQRKIIYETRNAVLDIDDMLDLRNQTITNHIEAYIDNLLKDEEKLSEEDIETIITHFNNNYLKINKLKTKEIIDLSIDDLIDYLSNILIKEYEEKLKTFLEKSVMTLKDILLKSN